MDAKDKTRRRRRDSDRKGETRQEMRLDTKDKTGRKNPWKRRLKRINEGTGRAGAGLQLRGKKTRAVIKVHDSSSSENSMERWWPDALLSWHTIGPVIVPDFGIDRECWARIFKHLWSSWIDSKELIPPAYVAWRAGNDNPIPTRFLAPIYCLKIRALCEGRG